MLVCGAMKPTPVLTGPVGIAARCPDDGLYCNGREYCDEDARQCRRSPEPCAHCYDAGCVCDEAKDVCKQNGGAKGDSI